MTESSRIVMSAAQVAEQLGGFVRGNPELQLTGFQPLHVAGESDLSFLHLTKYRSAALNSRAGAIIVNRGVELGERTLIVVCDASEAYRKAIDIFYPDVPMWAGVDPSAIIDGSATLGAGVQIGPRAIVGADVVVADGVSVMAGAIIGEACSIGRDSIIHYGAVLYPGVVVGERVTIHANAVVGVDGFGFRRSPDGKLRRIRQVGRLVIEDDVEVGACACVDRGTLAETRIGRGSKLDKFVYIAHNVELGSDCIVLGQSAVAGSTRVGSGSIMCMQSGAREHIVVGERTTVLARGFVVRDTPPDSVLAGAPAMPAARWRRVVAITKQLPEILGVYRKQLRTDGGAPENRRGTDE
jgi:UDP-3-O-[3-hydroxymyristoyl] glucosamine N-acyltransferase